MKASELIEHLQKLIEEHGDHHILVEEQNCYAVDAFTIGRPEYRKNIEYFDEDGNDWHADGFFVPGKCFEMI